MVSKGKDLDHISHYCPFAENDNSYDFKEENVNNENEIGELKEKFKARHDEIGATIFNTHLYLTTLPSDENTRFIYTCRNAIDVAWSFHKHLSNQVSGFFKKKL